MRPAVGCLAALVLVAGCGGHGRSGTTTTVAAAAAAPPRLPRVARPLTLPCPARPTTTVGYEGCGEKRMHRADAAVDRQARRMVAILRGSSPAARAARRHLVLAVRSWLAFRNAECESESGAYTLPGAPHGYAGGTSATLVYLNCAIGLDAAYARQLGGRADVLCTRLASLPAAACPRRG